MDAWWIVPLWKTLHFVGMVLVVGGVAVVDLRMLGVAKGLPLAPLQRLLPWSVAGFLINLVTGILLFRVNPTLYVGPPINLAFVAKLTFIALAGLNAVLFSLTGLKRVADGVGAGEDAPAGVKVVAGVSLFLWIGVIYWGRMLPFLGSAF